MVMGWSAFQCISFRIQAWNVDVYSCREDAKIAVKAKMIVCAGRLWKDPHTSGRGALKCEVLNAISGNMSGKTFPWVTETDQEIQVEPILTITIGKGRRARQGEMRDSIVILGRRPERMNVGTHGPLEEAIRGEDQCHHHAETSDEGIQTLLLGITGDMTHGHLDAMIAVETHVHPHTSEKGIFCCAKQEWDCQLVDWSVV
jgi:hypothetical protein